MIVIVRYWKNHPSTSSELPLSLKTRLQNSSRPGKQDTTIHKKKGPSQKIQKTAPPLVSKQPSCPHFALDEHFMREAALQSMRLNQTRGPHEPERNSCCSRFHCGFRCTVVSCFFRPRRRRQEVRKDISLTSKTQNTFSLGVRPFFILEMHITIIRLPISSQVTRRRFHSRFSSRPLPVRTLREKHVFRQKNGTGRDTERDGGRRSGTVGVYGTEKTLSK